jgi:hypothetical protein
MCPRHFSPNMLFPITLNNLACSTRMLLSE